jgi:hypothetical protein
VRRTPLLALALALSATTLAVASCGGGDSPTQSRATTTGGKQSLIQRVTAKGRTVSASRAGVSTVCANYTKQLKTVRALARLHPNMQALKDKEAQISAKAADACS